MKTFILKLEPHDDLISTRDKMGWGKSGRILLVWPEKEKLLNRQLDLVLIKRHASSLGAQIALVSRDSNIRYFAPRLGIPVYRNLAKARNSVWRLPRRFRRRYPPGGELFNRDHLFSEYHLPELSSLHLHRPGRDIRKLHPLLRFSFFLVGVLSFLLVVAILVPGAEIELVPQVQEQSVTIPIVASPAISSINIAGRVPIRRTTVIVEGRDSLPSGSSVNFPDHPSTGSVIFSNLTDVTITIPSGTIVRSLEKPPQRFEVTSTGNIPAGTGQTVKLPVRCLVPGPSGNLPAGSLVAIEGQLGTSLSVINPLPTMNGNERRLPVPDEDDRQQLERQLMQVLQDSALSEVEQLLAEGDIFVPESIRLVEVLLQEYQPEVGQPTDELHLQLRIRFEASTIAESDILSLAGMVLNSSLPEGYAPLNDAFKITHLDQPVVHENGLKWSLKASRQLKAVLSETLTVQQSLGLDPQEVKERLAEQLNLQSTPVVRLIPSWWPRLPYIPLRINVIVLEPETGSQAIR